MSAPFFFLNWNFSHLIFSEPFLWLRCSSGQRPM
jgi:hypothetical protein